MKLFKIYKKNCCCRHYLQQIKGLKKVQKLYQQGDLHPFFLLSCGFFLLLFLYSVKASVYVMVDVLSTSVS